MTTKHTQGPYAVRHDERRGKNRFTVVAPSPNVRGLEQTICEINGPWSHENYKANAERIALCLNNHDALVEALKAVRKLYGPDGDFANNAVATWQQVETALAKAGGAS